MTAPGYFVDVYLPVSIDETYTYHCSEQQFRKLERGMRVAVEFGKRKIHTGIVARKHRNPPGYFETKPILQILDDEPVLTEAAWKFYEFLSHYYITPMGSVLRVALPVSFLLHGEHYLIRRPDADLSVLEHFPEARALLEKLDDRLGTGIKDLVQQSKNKARALKIIHWLADNGLVDLQARVRERYKPRLVSYIDTADERAVEKVLSDLSSRAVKQKEAVLFFYSQYLPRRHPVPKKVLTERFSSNIIKTLVDKGIFREIKVPVDRQVFDETARPVPRLNRAQEKALQEIQTQWQTGKPVLLHGVTAAGKTEIYLNLIDETLRRQRQVLYLLPEIALTTQMVARIRERFGNTVAVYHSRYTPMERYEIWRHVLHNDEQARLVIGTRSALFLPFKALDLIVVDEEHDQSYKEYFHQPFYQARDMATVLARYTGARLLLGSATPSVESYHNARQGKYALVELTTKYHQAPDPEIRIVDLIKAYKEGRMKLSFASETLDAIRQTVSDGLQAMVFINRRGYAPVTVCKTCGHIEHCPHCSVPLTYHRHDQSLQCHYCGFRMPVQHRCRACGSTELDVLGRGTQKITDELQEIFPSFRIRRMDADSMRRKRALEEIIESFRRHEFDILVGTQMMTKGLDFGLLSLAVIVSADQLIARPDFRAHERAFQLLTQIAGRTGRRQQRGQVLIQAYETRHPVLDFVLRHDYRGFFETEISERKNFRYPPFYKMVRLELKARNPENLNRASDWLAKALTAYFPNVLGPSEPAVYKIRNDYIKEILVKFDPTRSDRRQREMLRKIVHGFRGIPHYRNVRLAVNVDP